MTESNKKTDKMRKPLFWRRKECFAPEVPKPVPDIEAGQPKEGPWYRPSVWKTAAAILLALLIVPSPAHGQFGVGIAAILAGLSQVESLMNTYVAAPLAAINQTQQSIATYEQEVVYPVAAINQARSSVQQFEDQFNQVSGMFRVNVSSATLPQSQSLESILLSRNANNVANVSPQFQNILAQKYLQVFRRLFS